MVPILADIDWDARVVAALIASLAALSVAVVQAIARRKDARDIEFLKAELDGQRETSSEFLRRYLEFQLEGKERELQAFKDILEKVQILREKVRSLCSNLSGYDFNELNGELSELTKDVIDSYARSQVHFTADDCTQAHRLKNKCEELTNSIRSCLNQHDAATECCEFPAEVQQQQDELADLHKEIRTRASSATEGQSA